MIDHPTTIELSGGIKREGIDRLVVEHVIRYTRGGYPKRVFLSSVTGIDSIPESQGYDQTTGIYRTVFKVQPVEDPDAETLFSVSGTYTIEGEKYPTPFKHAAWLSIPEQPLVIKSASYKLHDHELVVSLIVRRANGKIPKSVSFNPTASRFSGLVTNQITRQNYNPNTGELNGYYAARSRVMFADIDYASEVKSLSEQPGCEVTFEGRLNSTRSVTYKVISKAIKGKLLNVAMLVKWSDTEEIPSSFNLRAPFFIGTNVPTGVVDLSTVHYNPKTGLYEFGVVVNKIPEGHLEYTFNTQALVEDYPAIDFKMSVSYDHQCTYKASLLRTSLGNGLLQTHWKITSNETKSYKLAHLAVPPADLAIGIVGSKTPKVEYLNAEGELVTTWEVDTDNSILSNYKLTGHFIIDNKYVPWFVDITAKPIAIYAEGIKRESATRVQYDLSLVSDSKIKSVDSTTLYVLINRIPSTIKPVQEHNQLTNRITGYFDLPAQTDEAVEVELLGNLIVETDVIRKIPVHIKTVDYIPSPSVGTELQYETVEHTVVNDVEKLVLRPTFKDQTSPTNLELLGNRISLNGNEIVAPKVNYRNGLLTILFKFKPTGFAEEHAVTGKCILPGYEDPVETSFQSVVKFGSNSFPAIVTFETINIGTQLTSNLDVTLKDGGTPKSVKLVNLDKAVNLNPEHTSDMVEHFDPETGIFSFNLKCKEVVDEPVKYSYIAHLEIEDQETKSIQAVTVTTTHRPKPRYWTELVKYEVKGNRVIFTHKLSSNCGCVKCLVVSTKDMENYPEVFEYSPVTGLITHVKELKDSKVPQHISIKFEVAIVGTNYSATVDTGDFIYSPPAAATFLDRTFANDKMTYRWVFRDAMGGIPKVIRIEDFWKHNINIKARTINLIYDRNSGIGYVVVDITKAPKKSVDYFADAQFRFPSPDVNYYPLVIKTVG